MSLSYDEFDTPLGTMRAAADGQTLIQLDFIGAKHQPALDPAWRRQADLPLLGRVRSQLAEYFGGARRKFDLPLELRGTPFQRAVWHRLAPIAFGTTISYGALAASAGHAGSARAVGAAVGHNPLAIVIPCHRVIGADGSLTGYASGLQRKRWLLELERAVLRGKDLPTPPVGNHINRPRCSTQQDGSDQVAF